MPRNFEGSADFYKCERGSVRGGISVLPTPFTLTLCAADCPKVCNKGHAYPASLLTSLVDNNSKTLQGRDKAFHDSCCLPDGQVVNYLPDGQVVNYVRHASTVNYKEETKHSTTVAVYLLGRWSTAYLLGR